MKKLISLLMTLVMIATMTLTFSSPVSATDNVFCVTGAYCEKIFEVNSSDDYADVTFTVSYTGYYIIQTFGFYDEHDSLIESGAYMEVYSSDDYIGAGEYFTGYNGGCLFRGYFEENEEYRVYIHNASNALYGRLSFTQAKSYFEYDNPQYGNIPRIPADYNGSPTMTYPLVDHTDQALVFVVDYTANSNMPTRNYVVHAVCCSCTRMLLVVPHGHGFVEYGGYQVIFDVSPNSAGAPLTESDLYYLVVYRGVGPGDCLDHDDYSAIQITVEPADLQ